MWVDTGRKAGSVADRLGSSPGYGQLRARGWVSVSVRPGNRRVLDMTGMQGHRCRSRRTGKNSWTTD
jgi:hypothetical protein